MKDNKSLKNSFSEYDFMKKTLKYYKNNNLQMLEIMLRKASRINPANTDIIHLTGLVQYKIRNFNAALYWIDRALLINPTIAQYHFNKGLIYLEIKQYNKAKAQFQRVLELCPTHKKARCFLSRNMLNEE